MAHYGEYGMGQITVADTGIEPIVPPQPEPNVSIYRGVEEVFFGVFTGLLAGIMVKYYEKYLIK